MDIKVVEDQPCPTCGAMWKTPDLDKDDPLDWPNRPKMEEGGVWWWRCYNPQCSTDYYDPNTGATR